MVSKVLRHDGSVRVVHGGYTLGQIPNLGPCEVLPEKLPDPSDVAEQAAPVIFQCPSSLTV